MEQFLFRLERGDFETQVKKAEHVLMLIEDTLSEDKSEKIIDTKNYLNTFVAFLSVCCSWESTPINILNRIQKIVKDEETSIAKLAMNKDQKVEEIEMLKANIAEGIHEVQLELEQCDEIIAAKGELIVQNEQTIFTSGYCPLVLQFLISASKHRKFGAIVAECSGRDSDGHVMAKALADAGVQTVYIEDSCIFSYMHKADVVIIGCDTVFKSGGMRSFPGSSTICQFAKHNAKPVHVLSPTFTFSKEELAGGTTVNSQHEPNQKMDGYQMSNMVPDFDYVAQAFIDDYVTNDIDVASGSVFTVLTRIFSMPRATKKAMLSG